MIDRYKIKENYITRDPNPNSWRNHPNGNILKIYSDIISGDVLDFGCNHGSCTFLICENNNVSSVIGLDLNEGAIKVANQTKQELGESKISFILGNILDVVFDKKFDSIISFHTLEHIYPEDVDIVLEKLYNSLTDNGNFIISIPYEHAFDDGTQHVAFYNELTLSELFEKHNFKTVECLHDNRHSEGGILTGIFKK
jgi:2-polyprenyl-3-methyl-5-hydroxy-6-metoxy-1,4-benzoquinol methylase